MTSSLADTRPIPNGHVQITRLTPHWPFITAPAKARVKEATAKDGSRGWLRMAMAGLGLLAAASATVSIEAQYSFIARARHAHVIAGIEAAIPDVAALIFACLGIALALRGRRAIRARFLNAGAVATSVFMNFAAAGHGWRDLAIWCMPPVAYALASDTAIANVRSWALVKRGLEDDDSSPLAVAGRMFLYVLRFAVAPQETARGTRQALLNVTPLPEIPAPVPPAQLPGSAPAALAASPPRAPRTKRSGGKRAGPTKTARLLATAAERHDLSALPLDQVSALATGLAGEIDLHAGTARRVLLAHVRDLQSGGER